MEEALIKRSGKHFYYYSYYYYLPEVLQAQKIMTFRLETQGKVRGMGHSTQAKTSNVFTEGRLSGEISSGEENQFFSLTAIITEAISITSTYSLLLEIAKQQPSSFIKAASEWLHRRN